jgi:hypothetical protein
MSGAGSRVLSHKNGWAGRVVGRETEGQSFFGGPLGIFRHECHGFPRGCLGVLQVVEFDHPTKLSKGLHGLEFFPTRKTR